MQSADKHYYCLLPVLRMRAANTAATHAIMIIIFLYIHIYMYVAITVCLKLIVNMCLNMHIHYDLRLFMSQSLLYVF